MDNKLQSEKKNKIENDNMENLNNNMRKTQIGQQTETKS